MTARQRMVSARGGVNLPALGLGTWKMGEKRARRKDEVAALQLGLDLGLGLIDTAEMYSSGGAEQVVGEAIRGRRDEVYLVSKVLPSNASRKGTIKAAEQGNAAAQNNLGVIYDNGEGVIEDDREAVKWFRLAAEQGLANAQSSLGRMYANGEGVIEDDREAVKWFRLAAEQGDSGAQAFLGALYADGKGILQDNLRAHMWGNVASANGAKNGGRLRDLMAEKMTPAQIVKAQDMARQCMDSGYTGIVMYGRPR